MPVSLVKTLLLFFSVSTFAAPSIEPRISQLSEQFHQTMMDCPEKIWSGFDWKGLAVLFYRDRKQTSLLWSATENKFTEIKNSLVPEDAKYGTFSFFRFQGRPTLSLLSEHGDFSEEDMLEFGTHEMFHYQGQKDWMTEAVEHRATNYPLVAGPRILRRMIFDHLQKYFVSGQLENLRKARYWYDQWSRLFPGELKTTTDGYEGTARYVDMMARALVNKGCSAKDSELKPYFQKLTGVELGQSVNAESFELDAEGYDIGGLASLILRFGQKYSLKGWNKKVAEGNTPLQLVLTGVDPLVEEVPKEIEDLFLNRESEVNRLWGVDLDDDIKHWQDKSFVRVSTPFFMVNGSFSPKFFAFSTDIGLSLFPYAMDQKYFSGEGLSNFTARASSVIWEEYDAPCGVDVISFTLVHEKDLNLDAQNEVQEIEIDSATLTGRLVGQRKLGSQGFQYFCLE